MSNDCEHRLDMALDALEEAREELERLRPVVEAAKAWYHGDDTVLAEAVGNLIQLERDHA